jgi:hypothetical protein
MILGNNRECQRFRFAAVRRRFRTLRRLLFEKRRGSSYTQSDARDEDREVRSASRHIRAVFMPMTIAVHVFMSRRQVQGKSVHSAMALPCTICHLAETKGDMTTLSLFMPKPKICSACHEPLFIREHRPVANGSCLDCHDAYSL